MSEGLLAILIASGSVALYEAIGLGLIKLTEPTRLRVVKAWEEEDDGLDDPPDRTVSIYSLYSGRMAWLVCGALLEVTALAAYDLAVGRKGAPGEPLDDHQFATSVRRVVCILANSPAAVVAALFVVIFFAPMFGLIALLRLRGLNDPNTRGQGLGLGTRFNQLLRA
ncbi:MAG TPA: hypothetical protein VHL31_11440 [Geminicoccus sp.]|jgi:hypothetical protein|uniref:hypothetical protein n=1 Tax=Geminicoccus sp. TaxID=2024832 RepID=UPI002E30164C|nr:hypothetical protein [Geminicoccus sp.]HEX2526892.1 hypothetical protein [Geminicoccus sp.]